MSYTDLPRGTVLGGKYTIEGVLGTGGMGSVYQAVNPSIGRKVAIKLLDPKLANNADFVHRFQMEAKAAALIGHPGIVDVLDMGETDEGMPFIVMEHLEGVTLKALLKKSGALSAAQAVAILVPVLDALAAAHVAGVIHRDLKPANIFVCLKPKPAVKILDFGISKFSSGSGITQTGTSMGTPAYMSPEQVRGERSIGPQSDLYSIGAILYNLVSGHPPFEGESDLAVVARVLTDLHRPLGEVRPDLPPKLSTIADRLLIKAADQRPADAGQVKRALEAVAKPDYASVWAAAKVAMASDTSTGWKAVKPDNTPTTPTGGKSGGHKTKPSRPQLSKPPAQLTRAEIEEPAPPPPAARRNVLPIAVGLGVLLVGGIGGWLVVGRSQPVPPPGPIAVQPQPKDEHPVQKEPPKPAADPVKLTVTTEAPNAHFVLDGVEQACTSPCLLAREPGTKAQLVVSAEGFGSSPVELVFDAPKEIPVALIANAVKPLPGGTGRGVPKDKDKDPGKKKPGLTIDEQNPYK